MKHNIQELTPEERAQFLDAVHGVARHVSEACEQAIVRLLTEESGCLADLHSPTISVGVLVAPSHMIKQAKAHLMSEHDIGSARIVKLRTQGGQDPTAESMN